MKRLGVDCEGVIFHAHARSLSGALEALRKIQETKQFADIYVISRVNVLGRIYFPIRLLFLRFSKRTGIPWDNIYFCRRQKDKAVLCEKLGITDFVDDRFSVLRHMGKLEHRYAFGPTRRDFRKYAKDNKDIVVVRSWGELLPLLTS